MSKYDINLRKWILLLLPTYHRRPFLAVLVYCTIAPLRYIYVKFLALRNDSIYRLEHNGQTCYLRAVLNDMFDAGKRRITVTDYEQTTSEGKTIYMRELDNETVVAGREVMAPLVVNRRGFVGVSGIDFMINLPAEMEGTIDDVRLRAFVNAYKLVSKRYIINYI